MAESARLIADLGSSIAYLNGEYLPLAEAKLSPLDRGFTFGDGVYEVMSILKGHIFRMKHHLKRLNQSLKAIGIDPPYTDTEWQHILQRLVTENQSDNAWIYLQMSRGTQSIRDLRFSTDLKPTIFISCLPKPIPSKAEVAQGLKAIAVTDNRWKWCQIKTTSRLAYVMMNQEAVEAGADEAIILHRGTVLEGIASNVFLVRHGIIITPPKSNQILHGITRDVLLELAEKNNLPYRENKISEQELRKADELWISSATRGVHPVVSLNGQPIHQGKAGPLWEKMFDLYWAYRLEETEKK